MMMATDEIEFLDAQSYNNVSVIPLKTPVNYKLDVITLKKGFELDLVKVRECETSTVNTLIVENNSVTPLLLIDGEEIVGGDQNRIVNGTILIAPQSEMMIPVNCTEHGRWRYEGKFRHSDVIATSKTRFASMFATRSDASAQQAVWRSIDTLEEANDFHSPTQAMAESYENKKSDLNHSVGAFKIKKGQTGVLIIVDGEIKGFDLFLNSDVYSQYHEKILKSYLIDTDINDSVFAINIDEAKNLMANALEGEFSEGESIGLEKRFEIKSDDGLGTLYSYDDEMIHATFFTQAQMPDDTPESEENDVWNGQTIIF